MEVLDFIQQNLALIGSALAAVLALAYAIAKKTKSPEDDKIIERLQKFFGFKKDEE